MEISDGGLISDIIPAFAWRNENTGAVLPRRLQKYICPFSADIGFIWVVSCHCMPQVRSVLPHSCRYASRLIPSGPLQPPWWHSNLIILQNLFSNTIPQVTPPDTALCYSPCPVTFLNILFFIHITHCCPLPISSLCMCCNLLDHLQCLGVSLQQCSSPSPPLQYEYLLNTFTASYLNTQGLNNSCLKSPASTLVDLTFQSCALRSFSLNQLCNLSL